MFELALENRTLTLQEMRESQRIDPKVPKQKLILLESASMIHIMPYLLTIRFLLGGLV